MATVDWPTGRAFDPQHMRLSIVAPRAAWLAPFTGQRQSVTHAAERFQIALDLAPCGMDVAGEREAFFGRLARTGDRVRLWHFARPAPIGTMRGSPTVGANAAAGATSITINTTAGATLAGGDLVGVAGQLIQAAYPGATANGGGAMTLPLAVPLRVAITATAAVAWDKPTGEFQIDTDAPEFDYSRGAAQAGASLVFLEAF